MTKTPEDKINEIYSDLGDAFLQLHNIQNEADILRRRIQDEGEVEEVSVIPDQNNERRSWRQPTDQEVEELKEWAKREMGWQGDELDFLEYASIIVLEGYTTDCPGYSGRVMFSISGYLEAVDVFYWDRNDTIQSIDTN